VPTWRWWKVKVWLIYVRGRHHGRRWGLFTFWISLLTMLATLYDRLPLAAGLFTGRRLYLSPWVWDHHQSFCKRKIILFSSHSPVIRSIFTRHARLIFSHPPGRSCSVFIQFAVESLVMLLSLPSCQAALSCSVSQCVM